MLIFQDAMKSAEKVAKTSSGVKKNQIIPEVNEKMVEQTNANRRRNSIGGPPPVEIQTHAKVSALPPTAPSGARRGARAGKRAVSLEGCQGETPEPPPA
jgi:hypothetical protein